MRVLCFSRQVFTPLLTISTIILRVLHNQYMHVSYRQFSKSHYKARWQVYAISTYTQLLLIYIQSLKTLYMSSVISLALLLHCHRSIRSCLYSFYMHSILILNRVDGSSIFSLETVTGRAWTGLRIKLMKEIMIKRTLLGLAYEK